MDEIRADIRRMWDVAEADEAEVASRAFEMLDRATAVRRATKSGPDWAAARLAEGLARMYVARDVAAWGNKSYCIQALEASLDGLRDAAAHLPDGFDPSREEVLEFRTRLMVEWRAVQSEPTQDRIADLSLPRLRAR